ncbi:MAG: hypothetical protein WB646_09340 [Steroidobacteraceae bacterium]
MLQQSVIALIVLTATSYVVWAFMTMSRRQRLLDWLAAHGVARRAATAHRARLATPGCGSCSAADRHGEVKDG